MLNTKHSKAVGHGSPEGLKEASRIRMKGSTVETVMVTASPPTPPAMRGHQPQEGKEEANHMHELQYEQLSTIDMFPTMISTVVATAVVVHHDVSMEAMEHATRGLLHHYPLLGGR
eukprot:gene20871-27712_t